ncbi:hypothetical protein LR48_Vigan10g190900 [Vigna angularis]|uniref:Uncharacterized protein n=1 Tax=Phaseolus angularis TaxID=3914 RepID=A0A0L9VMB5_PHAAN|nr:hypothetical protein LR48_Vigan10g190900 [Vigna angularis]
MDIGCRAILITLSRFEERFNVDAKGDSLVAGLRVVWLGFVFFVVAIAAGVVIRGGWREEGIVVKWH